MEELKKALSKKNDENVKFYTGSKIIDYLKVCLILLDHTVFYADGSSEGARNIMRRTPGNCFFFKLFCGVHRPNTCALYFVGHVSDLIYQKSHITKI